MIVSLWMRNPYGTDGVILIVDDEFLFKSNQNQIQIDQFEKNFFMQNMNIHPPPN